MTRIALVTAAVVLAVAAPAAAAPELVKIGDFDQPVHIASPPEDTQLFVVEQGGRVKTLDGGTFLDISDAVIGEGERGLLSIAFAPDYTETGRFYVFYTAADPVGEIRVVEYTRSTADPKKADPGSARTIFHTPHPNPAHNGGQLQFGPDGMLYVSTGDNQVSANAQRLGDNPHGKILRLNPRTGGPAPGNPHGLIWAYGLRNPWRFSFDRETGDIAIGDVGLTTWEEIDWGAAPRRARNVNFGWPVSEGLAGTLGQKPIIAHHHDDFHAIIAGYVVRDPGLPTLLGRYIYTDLVDQRIWSARPRTGANVKPTGMTSTGFPTSFGEDACGRLYLTTFNGPVYRIQDGAPSTCVLTKDTTPPRIKARVTGLGTALAKRRVRVVLRPNEDCRVTIATRLQQVRRLRARRRTLPAHRRTAIDLQLSAATIEWLRNRLDDRPSVRVLVTVRATDDQGNTRTLRRGGRIRR
jgi:hypothetical protein